jgi:hypothetical protein
VADTNKLDEHGESQAHTAVLTTLAWHRWTPCRFAPLLFPAARRVSLVVCGARRMHWEASHRRAEAEDVFVRRC